MRIVSAKLTIGVLNESGGVDLMDVFDHKAKDNEEIGVCLDNKYEALDVSIKERKYVPTGEITVTVVVKKRVEPEGG